MDVFPSEKPHAFCEKKKQKKGGALNWLFELVLNEVIEWK